ncbi:MAG: nucleotidyltransferase family protein [Hyphomicrobiales bacterium]
MIGQLRYQALVLAAGRGVDDPMAKAFNTGHKCLVLVGGTPMLGRVVGALQDSENIENIAVCIDAEDAVSQALGPSHGHAVIDSASSAPASVLAALSGGGMDWPVLVTTADHALLTPEMVDVFLNNSAQSGADITVGLASRQTIEKRFPETTRTYFSFSDEHVSGCNMFALRNERALNVVRFWQQADRNRKKPWKIVGAFGIMPFLRWATGHLSLEQAFAHVSAKLGAHIEPVMLPFAEAAVDVDKPEDKDLVERILAGKA